MTMEAKGWPGRKFYLSNEAFALLKAHCEGTPLTMSAYLDGLIKAQLDSPAERFLRTQDGTLLPIAPAETVADTSKDGNEAARIAKRIAEIESTGRPPRDPREPLGDFQKVKQPAKKDFKIDL